MLTSQQYQNPLPFVSSSVFRGSSSSSPSASPSTPSYRSSTPRSASSYPSRPRSLGVIVPEFAIWSDPDTATLVVRLPQPDPCSSEVPTPPRPSLPVLLIMASAINDLDDSEDLYHDDDLDGSFVSESGFQDGRTQLLNVGGGDPQFDVENFLNNLRNLFYSSNGNGQSSQNTCVKDQLSLLARHFRQTADEKAIDGAQNMLLDSLNCIVLATETGYEANDSDTNSGRDPSINLANSENSAQKSAEMNGNSPIIHGFPIVNRSPKACIANVDLYDTAGSASARKRRLPSVTNEDGIFCSNPKANKIPRVESFHQNLPEQGRKLDFSNVEKQLESVSELMKKLIPPKCVPVTESADKCKIMSFNHLVNTNGPVGNNSKRSQETLNKFMSIKKKSFFPEKLRLKSSQDVVNSSQKSLHEQTVLSSQGQFQLRDQGSQYQTPIHMKTLPFTPVSSPSTFHGVTQNSDCIPRSGSRARPGFHNEVLGETSQPSIPVTKIDLESARWNSPVNSLDLEIISEMKKRDRSSICKSDSDNIFIEKVNNPGASNSGREVNRYGPKRIVNPRRYNASPSVNEKSTRSPVTTIMIHLHDAIVKLSTDENFK